MFQKLRSLAIPNKPHYKAPKLLTATFTNRTPDQKLARQVCCGGSKCELPSLALDSLTGSVERYIERERERERERVRSTILHFPSISPLTSLPIQVSDFNHHPLCPTLHNYETPSSTTRHADPMPYLLIICLMRCGCHGLFYLLVI
jgi:hypothetical protein